MKLLEQNQNTLRRKSAHSLKFTAMGLATLIAILSINVKSALAVESEIQKYHIFESEKDIQAIKPEWPEITIHMERNFHDPFTADVDKTAGLRLVIFYPSFESYQDHDNVKYINCAYYCNGRLVVFITNQSRALSAKYHKENKFLFGPVPQNAADFFARNRISKVGEDNITNILPSTDKNNHFNFFIKNIEGEKVETLWLKYANNLQKNYDLFADCTHGGFVEYASCTLYFSLQKCPVVSIEVYGLQESSIDDAWLIAQKINQFISPRLYSQCPSE